MTGLLLLMTAALALHLAEEVRTGFRRQFPLGEIPLPVFVGVNVGVYSFASAVVALSLIGHPAHVPMAWLFAVAVGLNGAAHLGAMAIRRAYFPGGVTAVLLVAAAGLVISKLLRL